MVRLYVNHDKLIDLSQYLYDKSNEMGELLKKMYGTIEKIDSAWDGPDSMVAVMECLSMKQDTIRLLLIIFREFRKRRRNTNGTAIHKNRILSICSTYD